MPAAGWVAGLLAGGRSTHVLVSWACLAGTDRDPVGSGRVHARGPHSSGTERNRANGRSAARQIAWAPPASAGLQRGGASRPAAALSVPRKKKRRSKENNYGIYVGYRYKFDRITMYLNKFFYKSTHSITNIRILILYYEY